MLVKKVKGGTFDASRYLERMLDNLRKGHNIFDVTPFCETHDGEWFLWIDEGKFEDLEKASVEALVKELTEKVENEHK